MHFTCNFADTNQSWRNVIEVNPFVWEGKSNKFSGSWACSSRMIFFHLCLKYHPLFQLHSSSNSNFFLLQGLFLSCLLWEENNSKQTDKQTKILWSELDGPKLFHLVRKPTAKKKKFKKLTTKLVLTLLSSLVAIRAMQGWQRQAPWC